MLLGGRKTRRRGRKGGKQNDLNKKMHSGLFVRDPSSAYFYKLYCIAITNGIFVFYTGGWIMYFSL